MSVPAAPDCAALAALLDAHAFFASPELVPELRVFQAHSLVEVWTAAEALAGATLPSPFWAYPWAGGIALARVLLDGAGAAGNARVPRDGLPDVSGARVLDFGAGGGIASLAAAKAGAARVVASDMDPWAAATTALAAERQSLLVETQTVDLTQAPGMLDAFDCILAGDLAYERHGAAAQRELLDRAHARGAVVLVADAGRTYFDETGMMELAAFTIEVPLDLEGVTERRARVFRMEG